MYIIFILLLGLALIATLLYTYLRRKVTTHLPGSFPTPVNRAKLNHNKPVVVCFGDSNTHGNVSHDWVKDLAVDMPDHQFINAGRNSDLSFTLLRRIDDVIACKPNFITLLIGTNDVNSTLAKSAEKRYLQTGRINANEKPSLVTFETNYSEIIRKLQAETNAKIGVLSLPLMGEDLGNKPNAFVTQYNAIIKRIASENKLTYLPLFETQRAYIKQHPSGTKYKFNDYFKLLNQSVFLHFFFGKTWDEISERHGTQLSPDFLHQNSTAGGMIARLVKDFLKGE